MKKLNLDKLKVESFITSLDSHREETVKGGKVPPGATGGPCTEQCDPGGDTPMCYPEQTLDCSGFHGCGGGESGLSPCSEEVCYESLEDGPCYISLDVC